MSYRDLVHKVYVRLPNTDTEHIDHWCIENFGAQGRNWDCWFASESPYNFDQYYAFCNHKDAMLFILKWV